MLVDDIHVPAYHLQYVVELGGGGGVWGGGGGGGLCFFFFFNDTATTEIYTLSLHDALPILGYSFLEQNLDRVKAAKVGGIDPTFENIASGEYGVSRSMYFYVKVENRMMVPGLADYVGEFTEEDAWGPDGYLVAKGLIPLLPDERAAMRQTALDRLTGSKNPPLSEHDPSPAQTDEDLPG